MKITTLLLTGMLSVFCSESVVAAEWVVVVNPQGPVATLKREDIKRIYVGSMRAFPGTEVAIQVADQPSDSEANDRFYDGLYKQAALKVKHRRAAYLFGGQGVVPKVLADDVEVRRYVAEHPAAIGYIRRASVDASVVQVYELGAEP